MKRWCFDNKNKKNNFYTQRIQSFFYFFFQIIFFLFLFFNFIFQTSQFFFFVTRISVGKFLRAFLIFFTRTHTRIPPRFFLPRTLKTRALPPPYPFQVVRQFRRFRIFRQFTLLPYNSEFSEYSKMYIYTFPDSTTSKLSEYS